MKEVLIEVYSSICQHKLRSFLTGLGIAWGMFILIVLLGAGNGLRVGLLRMFEGYASNSIWVSGRWVSQPRIGGIQAGERVRFNKLIISQLQNRFPQIISVTSEVHLENVNSIRYKGNMGTFEVKGIDRNYNKIKILETSDGRSFNKIDYQEKRRVTVIGSQVKEELFKNEDPIGKYISIAGVYFKVVGVLEEGTILSIIDQNNIYIPDVTLQYVFNLDDSFLTFGALLNESTSIETFETELRNSISQIVGFNKDDRGALFVNNIQLQVQSFNSLFKGINIFLWSLGVCFLLSGMLGITNIMLVVVKERTAEIGIRKALGATPNSILVLIISEAVVNTVIFGIIGLILGYMGIGFYNWLVSALQAGQQEVLFAKASVDLYIVLIAFLLLVVSGVIAGVFPAQKAAQIMPIETLNKMN